jgi:hypothetical protein
MCKSCCARLYIKYIYIYIYIYNRYKIDIQNTIHCQLSSCIYSHIALQYFACSCVYKNVQCMGYQLLFPWARNLCHLALKFQSIRWWPAFKSQCSCWWPESFSSLNAHACTCTEQCFPFHRCRVTVNWTWARCSADEGQANVLQFNTLQLVVGFLLIMYNIGARNGFLELADSCHS